MGEILNQQEIDSLVEAAIYVFSHSPLPCFVPEMIGWKIKANVIWVFTERDYRADN